MTEQKPHMLFCGVAALSVDAKNVVERIASEAGLESSTNYSSYFEGFFNESELSAALRELRAASGHESGKTQLGEAASCLLSSILLRAGKSLGEFDTNVEDPDLYWHFTKQWFPPVFENKAIASQARSHSFCGLQPCDKFNLGFVSSAELNPLTKIAGFKKEIDEKNDRLKAAYEKMNLTKPKDFRKTKEPKPLILDLSKGSDQPLIIDSNPTRNTAQSLVGADGKSLPKPVQDPPKPGPFTQLLWKNKDMLFDDFAPHLVEVVLQAKQSGLDLVFVNKFREVDDPNPHSIFDK